MRVLSLKSKITITSSKELWKFLADDLNHPEFGTRHKYEYKYVLVIWS